MSPSPSTVAFKHLESNALSPSCHAQDSSISPTCPNNDEDYATSLPATVAACDDKDADTLSKNSDSDNANTIHQPGPISIPKDFALVTLSRSLDDLLISSSEHAKADPAILSSPISNQTTQQSSDLSPADIESSRKVRRKYGLEPLNSSRLPSLSSNTAAGPGLKAHNWSSPTIDAKLIGMSYSSSYEALFQSIDEQLANFPAKKQLTANQQDNPEATATPTNDRCYQKEIATLFGMLQLVIRQFMDEFVRQGIPVENEHPLLPVLCILLELIIYHGWKGSAYLWKRPSVWQFLQKISSWTQANSSISALENVRQFSMLKSSASKVKAWIHLALMNKCLGPDLALLANYEVQFIRDYFEPWACIRTDTFLSITGLISSLDTVDFNLYIREQAIPKGDFCVSWEQLFLADRIDFSAINPSVQLPTSILEKLTGINSGILSPSLESQTTGNDRDRLLKRIASLNEENQRLRRSLVTQINQRVYFEEAHAKCESRLSKLTHAHQALVTSNAELLKKESEYAFLVQEHERTIKNLEQLKRTKACEPTPTSNGSKAQHAIEHKDCQEMLEQGYQKKIQTAQAQWDSRERMLLDELRIANALKNEYRQRLAKYEENLSNPSSLRSQ